ncbi:MAG TPA: GGDEF domain-containing protein [Streptosporangiaceae bacterium]
MTGWALWRLPPALRWYVTGVIAAAFAAAATAAALTSWHADNAWLFVALACFGVAAVELTRGTGVPAGLIKDVYGVWQLPIALLLPPVYCLAAPIATFAMLQLRTRRTVAHRQVFSAAAGGLSLAAASAVFHVVHSSLRLWSGPGHGQVLPWLLAATGCALLWSALSKILVMTAVKLSDPTVSARERLLAREPLLNDCCEIGAGLLLAGAVAGVSWVLLIPALPLAIALQRSFRHDQLVSAARIDGKTGLLNAAAWQAEARVELTRASRTHAPLAMAMIDIDHFKQVNDTHGHLAGDAVLATLAAGMRGLLRDYDLIGRFGGEEFCVLLPQTTPAEAAHTAERLRTRLAQLTVPAADGNALGVTVSIGVAALPASRCDLEELIAAADAALYRAKREGRDRVRITTDQSLDPGHPASQA